MAETTEIAKLRKEVALLRKQNKKLQADVSALEKSLSGLKGDVLTIASWNRRNTDYTGCS